MALTGLATAGSECKVPPDRWMKESDFKFHLQHLGYLIKTIEVINGCYEVYGLDPLGRRIQLRFNPETAEPLESN